MIATIAVVAVIAEKKKFSDRSDHSDYKESTFQRPLEKLWWEVGNFRAAGSFFRNEIACMNFF